MKNFFIILLVPILLMGCSKNVSYEPQEINPEIDVCEVCNMSITEVHFATQLISKDGEVYKFDDIGCMIEFVEKNESIEKNQIAKQYVRDFNSGDWVELKDAYHVYDPDIWTPMANGIVSFSTKESAKSFIKEQGKGEIYDFEKLKTHTWSWSK